jgi:signal transduction histidine kinase
MLGRAAAALCGLLLALLGVAHAQAAAVMVLLDAGVSIEPVGPRRLPPRIMLPLHWDVMQAGHRGSAIVTMDFDVSPAQLAAREPHAILIERLGNAYEVHLNGTLLATRGRLDAPRDTWAAKLPVHLSVPDTLLRERNHLEVRLRADSGRRAGLSPPIVGPATAIEPLAVRAELVRVRLPQAAAVLSLIVAAFCALLWWQQRDPLYLWAGLAEGLWAFAVTDTLLEQTPLPWPYWGLLVVTVRALWSWALYALLQRVFGARPRREFWAMLVVQASAPVLVVVATWLQWSPPITASHLLVIGMWVFVLARLSLVGLRAPSWERGLLWTAVAASLVAGLRDAYAARLAAELYAEPAWLKYVTPTFAAVVLGIVGARFRHARLEVERLNQSLAAKVAARESELRESFVRVGELERERAVLAERQRILRDMHDGVGSGLATALRQLEAGRASEGDLALLLRESLDQLKLSIDAMNLPPGDVNALLASLRYRLQPRIEAAHLVLHWNVDALPPWPGRHEQAMRHLQYLLLEAISNALQHARASELRLSARVEGDCIEVCLADDGVGLRGSQGQGLRSMRTRSAEIGAGIEWLDAAPGTCVRLRLPLVGDAGQSPDASPR